MKNLLILLAVPMFLLSCKMTAEKTANSFTTYLEEGEFGKASDLTILDTRRDMRRLGRSTVRGLFNFEDCECTKVSDRQYQCVSAGMIDGRLEYLVMDLTSINGKWYIYEIDDKRRPPQREIGEANLDSPEERLNDVMSWIKEGNHDKALNQTALDGYDLMKEKFDDGKEFPVSISGVNCNADNEVFMCSCTEHYSGGKKVAATYKMLYLEEDWYIIGFSGGYSPERIVQTFATALADGDCELAMSFANGEARESVQGLIDAGCESYETEVKSIFCETYEDQASCTCEENRSGMEMTFNYDLGKVDGNWKVANYQKDLGMDMDLGEGTEETTEAVEEIVEMVDMPEVSDHCDVLPKYTGGADAFDKFIEESTIYPSSARSRSIQGDMSVSFIVHLDGHISDVEVHEPFHNDLAFEAERLVMSLPDKWTPAQLNGEPVIVWHTVVIKFRLPEDK